MQRLRSFNRNTHKRVFHSLRTRNVIPQYWRKRGNRESEVSPEF